MTVGIYIEYAGRVVQLPVNPASIQVTYKSDNETVNTINLGEVNRLAKAGLKEISFESFFSYKTKPYCVGKNRTLKPNSFVDFLRKIHQNEKPCRIVVTDTKINFLASIESFEYSTGEYDNRDINYSITFKEYRECKAKFVKIQKPKSASTSNTNGSSGGKAVTSKNKQQQSTNKQVTIGCTVIVNGRLHRDSYGSAPGKTEKNATRKVNFINKKGSHPYHVTTMSGGWRGWVTKDSVVVQ